jgi:hypothetical protein
VLVKALYFSVADQRSKSVGNTINKLDKSFRFNGATTTSPATGYVAMLNHQIGDYVSGWRSFGDDYRCKQFWFCGDVPYEYLQIIKNKGSLPITLPDDTVLQGRIAKVMPSVDAVSQTVKVLLQVSNNNNIPENLIGTISFSNFCFRTFCS